MCPKNRDEDEGMEVIEGQKKMGQSDDGAAKAQVASLGFRKGAALESAGALWQIRKVDLKRA